MVTQYGLCRDHNKNVLKCTFWKMFCICLREVKLAGQNVSDTIGSNQLSVNQKLQQIPQSTENRSSRLKEIISSQPDQLS